MYQRKQLQSKLGNNRNGMKMKHNIITRKKQLMRQYRKIYSTKYEGNGKISRQYPKFEDIRTKDYMK